MNEYEKVGFKCGLEIHQRVEAQKLFCSCYSDPNKPIGEKTSELTRGLRATVGETGEVDVAAAMQAKSARSFKYIAGERTACLVESDEEPPHPINSQALETALQVAKQLKCKMPGEVHVMRKTIIDGSSVSGFQRTALIAIDGELEVKGKKIGVQTVCIEEESAGIVNRSDSTTEYRLDRQGIPLVEIATDASITSPGEAKQVALALGTLLRNTGKVQRGLGTIRQDVNVSIKGGTRVEIKGAQDLDSFEEVIKNEVKRQRELIKLAEELKKRGAKVGEQVDLTSVFSATNCKFIASAVSKGGKVVGAKLLGFEGKLAQQLGAEGLRLGRELGDYAKLAGAGGVIHSDENLLSYGITEGEVEKARKTLGVKPGDAFVLCVERGEGESALKAALKRAEAAALRGVVPETRRADGIITRFMRPLAGAARMYPETDLPVIKLDEKAINALGTIETQEEKIARYKEKYGLNEQLAKRMAEDQASKTFETISSAVKANKNTNARIATTLLETMVALRREGVNADSITPEHLIELFKLFESRKIASAAIEDLLVEIGSSPGLEPAELSAIIKKNKLERFGKKEIEQLIEKHRGNLSEVMRLYRKNVEASDVQEALKRKRK